jgi:hypothetical protein
VPLDTNFWSEFEFMMLRENMRQKEDPIFAELLNRVRFGRPSLEDINKLNERLIDQTVSGVSIEKAVDHFLEVSQNFPSIMCLFPKTEQVDQFNNCITKRLQISLRLINAIDSNYNSKLFQNRTNFQKNKPRVKVNSKPKKKTNQTAGLETTLSIGKGSRIMLRRNLDVNLGLVNGAIGTVTDFVTMPNDDSQVLKIKIKFDNIAHEQYIDRFIADYEFQKRFYVSRSQFPLSLAWAITIHKSQGLSLSAVMLDLGSNIFEPGMAYVALSRARVLDKVFLLDFDPTSLYCSPTAVKEYQRLAKVFNIEMDEANQFNIMPSGIDTSRSKRFKNAENNKKVDTKENNITPVNENGVLIDCESSICDTLMQYINSNKNLSAYPLKLINDDNSCFSNSNLQCLLHLGPFHFKLVYDNDSAYKNIFSIYHFSLYQAPKSYNSIAFRNFVGQQLYPNIYVDGSQQDAFLFFLDWYSQVPNAIKNSFSFSHFINVKCPCGHESQKEDHLARYINIPLNICNRSTKFDSCFFNHVNQYCPHCKKDKQHTFDHSFVFPSQCKYVVLSIQLFDQAAGSKKIQSKLKNYDVNNIILPTRNNIAAVFRIRGIIIRNGESISSGHYYAWVPSLIDDAWYKICDTFGTKRFTKLPNTLDNICLIYLGKVEINRP